MANKIVIERFPEELIALQEEIGFHADLVEQLQQHPVREFEIRLACVAAYCGVALDGTYTPEDVVRLCALLKEKLYKKRTPIIFLN